MIEVFYERLNFQIFNENPAYPVELFERFWLSPLSHSTLLLFPVDQLGFGLWRSDRPVDRIQRDHDDRVYVHPVHLVEDKEEVRRKEDQAADGRDGDPGWGRRET